LLQRSSNIFIYFLLFYIFYYDLIV